MKDGRTHHRFPAKDHQGPSQKKGVSVPVIFVLFCVTGKCSFFFFFGAVISRREGISRATVNREALRWRTTGGLITIVRPRFVEVHASNEGPPHAGYLYFCFEHENAGQFGADRG